MTVRGIIIGWLKLSLTCRAVSVQPADAVYSPAESVVGIVIERTLGALTSGRRVVPSAVTWTR